MSPSRPRVIVGGQPPGRTLSKKLSPHAGVGTYPAGSSPNGRPRAEQEEPGRGGKQDSAAAVRTPDSTRHLPPASRLWACAKSHCHRETGCMGLSFDPVRATGRGTILEAVGLRSRCRWTGPSRAEGGSVWAPPQLLVFAGDLSILRLVACPPDPTPCLSAFISTR